MFFEYSYSQLNVDYYLNQGRWQLSKEKYKEAIQAQIEADKFSTQKNIVGGGKLQFEIDLDPNKKLNNHQYNNSLRCF